MNVPNQIRSKLLYNDEWSTQLECQDYSKLTTIYINVLMELSTYKSSLVKTYIYRKRVFITLTTVFAVITCICAIAAAAVYGSQLNGGSKGQANYISFVLSICTGVFVFITGTCHIINEYHGYGKRVAKLTDDITKLRLIASTVNKVLSNGDVNALRLYIISTNYFYNIEREMFEVDDSV